MIKLFGKELAESTKKDLADYFSNLKDKANLDIILVGDNQSSLTYINYKIKFANEIGVNANFHRFDKEIKEKTLIDNIKKISKNTDGIIVQLPLPDGFNKQLILDSFDPIFDVDGLSTFNQNAIINDVNEFHLKPATALAIVNFMNFHKIDYVNKSIGIVGQSSLIGKPLFHLLNKESKNKIGIYDLNSGLNGSDQHDILVVATGSPNLIKDEHVKNNSTLIDVGFTRIENKIYGDIDVESIEKKIDYLAPAIGSIGPLTVVSLFLNLKSSMIHRKRK